MLQVENLSYRVKNKILLDRISMTVRDGEFVGIIGPNGSGKSTLLKNIYKRLKPESGSVRIDGEDLASMTNRRMARHLAVVTQEDHSNFDFTVEEVVLMGRYSLKKVLQATDEADGRIVRQALEQTGMEAYGGRSFLTLSGGEKKRVMIARAFAQETGLVILDEPTNHLDAGSQIRILSLLRASGKTVVAALHDLSLASRFCDRIYVLLEGKILCEGKPEQVISKEVIDKLYGMESDIFWRGERMHIDYL